SAHTENGPTRTRNHSTFNDKWARWSQDGRQVAFIADRSGEELVWVVSQDGSDPPRQLTQGLAGMLYAPEWSPDGRSIAFSDKDGKVYVLTVANARLRTVADDARGQVEDYVWSPGGSYL